jgi:hypothetical protein
MLSGNLRRGFNRLFLVLTVGWVVYWTAVFPILSRGKSLSSAYRLYLMEDDECSQRPVIGKDEATCRKGAKDSYDRSVADLSLRNTYAQDWLLILIVGLGYPPIVYALGFGSLLGIRAVCLWIWRGYKHP